jgi:hypothetical protein
MNTLTTSQYLLILILIIAMFITGVCFGNISRIKYGYKKWMQGFEEGAEIWKERGDYFHKRLQETEKNCIRLTSQEIQSGLTRVRWAELLIKQLPSDHDGRNSWLLNYGTKK